MKSSKMEVALNTQINAELWSAYLYLAMSNDFACKGLQGFASWMFIQFKEEQDHAMKINDYIISRGGRPVLHPIEAVKMSWNKPLDAFNDALAHEQKVTSMIDDLYTIAMQEKDYATETMLQWFVSEQIEEIQVAQSFIDKLTMIGDNGFGLYTLDKELARRVYTPLSE